MLTSNIQPHLTCNNRHHELQKNMAEEGQSEFLGLLINNQLALSPSMVPLLKRTCMHVYFFIDLRNSYKTYA